MMTPEQDAELRAYWLSQRFRQPFAPRMLFDCRFANLPEMLLMTRHRAWVDSLRDTSTGADHPLAGLNGREAAARIMGERVKMAAVIEAETGQYCAPFVDVRRMGLGDMIVLVGVIQAVERVIGRGNVAVCYDSRYPGAQSVFGMSGLPCFTCEDSAAWSEYLYGFTTIDCRRHCMAHPLTDYAGPYYGELTGDPSQQILWNLGWERIVPHSAANVTLYHSGKCLCDASHPFLACQPMERTRGNEYATPERFRAQILTALQETNAQYIVYGSSPADANALREFVGAINLQIPTYYACGSLPDWCATIAASRGIVCGNTSAMWLAFGLGIKPYIISDASLKHGSCWEPKSCWFNHQHQTMVRTQSVQPSQPPQVQP